MSRSGLLRYWSMARWNSSVLSVPVASVLSVIRRFTVFTATSARQLLWGKATDERR